MLLNEGLLKSSRPVKDPCSTGTHKTQTVPGWRMGSCSGGGMKNGYRQENRKADRQTANAKDRQNGEKKSSCRTAVTDDCLLTNNTFSFNLHLSFNMTDMQKEGLQKTCKRIVM